MSPSGLVSIFAIAVVAVSATPAIKDVAIADSSCTNYNMIMSLRSGPVHAGCQFASWRTAFLMPNVPTDRENITDVEFRVRLGSRNGQFHALYSAYFCCAPVGPEGTELEESGTYQCQAVSMSRSPAFPPGGPISEFSFRQGNVAAECRGIDTVSMIVVARGPYTVSGFFHSTSPWPSQPLKLDAGAELHSILPGTRQFFHVEIPDRGDVHSVRVVARLDRHPFRASVHVAGRWDHPVHGDPLNREIHVSPLIEDLNGCVEVARPRRRATLFLAVHTPPQNEAGRYTIEVRTNVADSSCNGPDDIRPI